MIYSKKVPTVLGDANSKIFRLPRPRFPKLQTVSTVVGAELTTISLQKHETVLHIFVSHQTSLRIPRSRRYISHDGACRRRRRGGRRGRRAAAAAAAGRKDAGGEEDDKDEHGDDEQGDAHQDQRHLRVAPPHLARHLARGLAE